MRVYLRGVNDTHEHLLTEYFRTAGVIWSPDSRTIIFLDEHSAEDTRVKVFRVEPSGATAVGNADASLRRFVRSKLGRSRILFVVLQVSGFNGGRDAIFDLTITYLKYPQKDGPSAEMNARISLNLRSYTVNQIGT
jgi:hypothetical protein